MIQIAGSVDDAMHFNLAATNNVKYKVGFYDENAIPIFSKFLVTRYPSEQWMLLERSNPIIKLVYKRACSIRTVVSNEVKY